MNRALTFLAIASLQLAVVAPGAAQETANTDSVYDDEDPTPESFRGFRIATDDGAYALKLGGFLQVNGRFYLDDAPEPADTFVVRRTRLDMRATLAEYFKFRLHPDLSGSNLTLLDAFMTIAFFDELQLRAGKMKRGSASCRSIPRRSTKGSPMPTSPPVARPTSRVR